MPQAFNSSFRDIRQYPTKFLQVLEKGVRLPVTYKKSWNDGFGARGWKLNIAIGNPEIIASTRETGQRINTSVFVHDILDHFLSGFGVSGHRSEAMALIQLSRRTNSDPTSDYAQMVEEDILNGRVNREPLLTFLPKELREALPSDSKLSDIETISFLKRKFSGEDLRDILVNRFFTLGNRGKEHAINSWSVIDLRTNMQTEIGMALQNLLEVTDSKVEGIGIDLLEGLITIDNEHVSFTLEEHCALSSIFDFQTTVA
jgi:hypothetical protein